MLSSHGSHGEKTLTVHTESHQHPSTIIHHQVIIFIRGMWFTIPPISNLVDLEGGVDQSDIDINFVSIGVTVTGI